MIRIEAIGNLGRDAELRMAGSTEVLNFSIGAKGSRKDAETVWVRCAIFGKRAESLAQYMKKGQRVFVRGEMKLRAWSKDGKSGTDVECTVDELELLSSKEASQASSGERRAPARQQPEDDPTANW